MPNTLASSYLTTRHKTEHSREGASRVLARPRKKYSLNLSKYTVIAPQAQLFETAKDRSVSTEAPWLDPNRITFWD